MYTYITSGDDGESMYTPVDHYVYDVHAMHTMYTYKPRSVCTTTTCTPSTLHAHDVYKDVYCVWWWTYWYGE